MASGMRNDRPSTSPAITTPIAMIDMPTLRSFSLSADAIQFPRQPSDFSAPEEPAS